MKSKIISALSLSLILAGCGGGGGGSSSSTPTGGSGNPGTPTVTPANLITAAPSTYTGENLSLFTAINAFRQSQGLGPWNESKLLDTAAANHQAYLADNPSVGETHDETAGNAGFTGATPAAQAQYVGYTGFATQEIGLPAVQYLTQPGAGTSVFNNLVATVYHRYGLQDQFITDVGLVVGDTDAIDMTVIDFGDTTPQTNASNYLQGYPVANATGISLAMTCEIPQPAGTTCTPGTGSGNPININSAAGSTLVVTTFTVTPAGSSSPLPVTMLTSANDSELNSLNATNTAFIVPTSQLTANTVYNVSFSGTVNNQSVSQNWSFTTGNQ